MDMMKKAVLVVLGVSLSAGAFAQDVGEHKAGEIYKGRYIVSFKEPTKESERIVKAPDYSQVGKLDLPFGTPSTGQKPEEIERLLNLNGTVLSIYETINAVYVEVPDEEAARLSRDPRVLIVEPNRWTTLATTQTNPGWGLDRLDETTTTQDNTFVYNQTGAGRTIYIIDTGLNVGTTAVTNEFGTRATVAFDVNGGAGNDCVGHGTEVASIAAGNTYGVAKGATVVMGKVTEGCTGSADIATSVDVFNWLAMNAPAGSVVNWSRQLSAGNPNDPCAEAYSIALDNSIFSAHQAGKLIFVSAGNDGCDTYNFSPLTIPQSFVVGATSDSGFAFGYDYRASFSRIGDEIDAWAPGVGVAAMDHNGNAVSVNGTSFSAPYVAGLATLACAASGTWCDITPVQNLYNAFKATGVTNTVRDWNGSTLPVGVPATFIDQQW